MEQRNVHGQLRNGQCHDLKRSDVIDERTTHIATNIQHGHQYFCRCEDRPSKHQKADKSGNFDSPVSYWIVPCPRYGSTYNGSSLWQGGFTFKPIAEMED